MTLFGIMRVSSGIWFLLMFSTFLKESSGQVSVKVKDPAILNCNGTCNGHLTWTYYNNNEPLTVLRCEKEKCTEGDSFKNRVSPVEANIQPGIVSLTLYPVLYNDEGWFEVKCDSTILCSIRLEVFVPTTMNSSVKSNVKLHCYARTEKQILDESVYIQWKKDGQIVFEVQNGIQKNVSGYTDRASVSLKDYKDGDLSLTLSKLTTSDTGLYQCNHKPSGEHGYPGAITLYVAVHEIPWTKNIGEDLTLDLFGSDVTVTFIESNGAVRNVCSVTGSRTSCSPDYVKRVSVKNDSLVLSGLTSSDKGTFTVKDKMGNVIAVNTVAVEDTDYRHFYAALCVLTAFVIGCICLFLMYKLHRRSPVAENRFYYNGRQCTMDTDFPREPAYIRVSEQETNPHVSESEVCPRTPVEETMPDTNRPTEKQDNTVEEEDYKG